MTDQAEEKEEKTAECQIQFEGWDWKNVVTVKSTTGKVISFSTNGNWHLMPEEFKKKMRDISLSWERGNLPDFIEQDRRGKKIVKVFTYTEMKLMLQFSQSNN